MPSGRPKGGTNKYWTPEEKERQFYIIQKMKLVWTNVQKNLVILERKCLIGFLPIEIKEQKV